jgi:hypothetical protein
MASDSSCLHITASGPPELESAGSVPSSQVTRTSPTEDMPGAEVVSSGFSQLKESSRPRPAKDRFFRSRPFPAGRVGLEPTAGRPRPRARLSAVGCRLFEDATEAPKLCLVETRPFHSGIVLLRYRTA